MEITKESALTIVETYQQLNALKKNLSSPPFSYWEELLGSSSELNALMEHFLHQRTDSCAHEALDELIQKVDHFCRISSKVAGEGQLSSKLKGQYELMGMKLKSLKSTYTSK